MMFMLCNCCVRELLILARTWFTFGLPSKTGCDTPTDITKIHTMPWLQEIRVERGRVEGLVSSFESFNSCVIFLVHTLTRVTHPQLHVAPKPPEDMRVDLGLVRLHRIVPGIVPANQSLYKLEKQSGSESFRPTNPTQTNKSLVTLSL
jgi:hypothetical protein